MGELPILFSTPMVQAILDGLKCVTRRVIKPQPPEWIDQFGYTTFTPSGQISGRGSYEDRPAEKFFKCPYGQPGDRLWVRETWCELWRLNDDHQIIEGTENYYYRADGINPTPFNWFPDDNGENGWRDGPRWKPSIYMPKAAARIWLEVTNVRVERLREITYDDCLREGMWNYGTDVDTLAAFQELWQKLNAKRGYGWYANPWVWVVEFKVVVK